MASYRQTAFRIFVTIFNIVYNVLHFLGIDLVPVTMDEFVRKLTKAEKKIFLKQGFTEPLKIIVEECNTPGNTISGFHRFYIKESIMYVFKGHIKKNFQRR